MGRGMEGSEDRKSGLTWTVMGTFLYLSENEGEAPRLSPQIGFLIPMPDTGKEWNRTYGHQSPL